MPRKPVTEEIIIDFINKNEINAKFLKLEIIKDKSNRKMYFVHFICHCGKPHKSEWNNFKKTQNCGECGKEGRRIGRVKYTKQYVVNYLRENGYEIIGDYVNSGISFTYRCLACGNTGRTNFGNFVRGRRCRVCKGFAKKDTESFNRLVNEITDDEYEFIGEYENAHVKSDFLHKVCNHSYKATPHSFLMGRRCPKCKSSKGEKRIEEFLIKHSFNFERQFKFEKCRYILPLPFDFAIFDNKNKLKYLIEFDGKQHFHPIEAWGGQENLTYVKQNDEIKNKYCSQNSTPLIRIPYWDFNRIEELLSNELLCSSFKREEDDVSII